MSDICQDPASGSLSDSPPYIVIRDNAAILDNDPVDHILAHDLGHALFLGHGNGLDDDGDGFVDECCDSDEDQNQLPLSLMSPQGSSKVITQPQMNMAREIAKKIPGAN